MFGEATTLAIKLYGLAIVISFLVAGMIRVVVITLEKIQKKPAAAPKQAAVATTQPQAAPQEDPAAGDIPVIAAAVAATIGAVRIVRIEPTGTGWRDAGRIMQKSARTHSKKR